MFNPITFYEAGKLRDDDVTIFLKKSGITDSIIKSSLRTFYDSLKSSGLWNKIKVIYPMVGGTAFTTKFDLVRKNNSAFDIVWNGAPIFTVNGVNGGAGLNAYGNTNFQPNAHMITGNEGYTTCVGTNDAEISSDSIYLGAFRSAAYSIMVIKSTFTARLNSAVNTVSNPTKLGVYSISRNSNTLTMVKNGLNILTNATTGAPANLSNMYLLNSSQSTGATNPYTNGYSTGRMQTTIFHEGLTNSETATLHGILNTFENALGRKTW